MPLYAPMNIVDIYDDIAPEYPSLAQAKMPISERKGYVAAAKTGYHDSVHGNKAKDPNDYSIRLALDLKGDYDAARAIDISLNEVDMIKGSKRLLNACQNGDPRVYGMREFIGTIDGHNVIAYNRKGDGGSGTRGTAGVKYGSDAGATSHLWHIHISFFTIYATSNLATKAITSVLLGEPVEIKLSDEDILKIAKKVWELKAIDAPGDENWSTAGTLRYIRDRVQDILLKING